jgi:cation-transporting ATPase 13A1
VPNTHPATFSSENALDSFSLQARKSKEEQLKQLQSVPPTPATQQVHNDKIKALSDAIAALDSAAAAVKDSAQRSLVNSVRVLQRHHFSSALQRMSVVVSCQGREPYSGLYCLVKGSPEALLPLMDPAQLPKWSVFLCTRFSKALVLLTLKPCRYTSCYESLALKGLRVLCLGYRRVGNAPADGEYPREWVESGLTFAGFIAFTCKTRADSRAVCLSPSIAFLSLYDSTVRLSNRYRMPTTL